MYYHPTMYTAEDTLTRAEKERERERDLEFIDDLERADNEADDFILALDELAKQSGDMAYAAMLVRMAQAMVQKRVDIAKRFA